MNIMYEDTNIRERHRSHAVKTSSCVPPRTSVAAEIGLGTFFCIFTFKANPSNFSNVFFVLCIEYFRVIFLQTIIV